MGRRVSIEDALGKVEKLYKLTESKLVENDNRWIAFNELSRKNKGKRKRGNLYRQR